MCGKDDKHQSNLYNNNLNFDKSDSGYKIKMMKIDNLEK